MLFRSIKEKNRLLDECMCFVFPSRAEGFGIPPVEAMAKGKQVLVSSLEIFQEILDPGYLSFEITDDTDDSAANLSDAMIHGVFEVPENYGNSMKIKYGMADNVGKLYKIISNCSELPLGSN